MPYGYTFVPSVPFAVREMGRRKTAAPAGDRTSSAWTLSGILRTIRRRRGRLHVKLLLQNEAHEGNLKGATAVTAEEVNRALADPDFPLREKFLAFVKRLLAR